MIKILFTLIIISNFSLLANTGSVTGLDIPRFVSLKSNDVNLRVGPSVNYPINIKYNKKNYPIEIIDEFDTWRKVRDFSNNIGWLHRSLIKSDRFVLSRVSKGSSSNIYNRPKGKIIGTLGNNNILKLNKCTLKWCYIEFQKISGWVYKDKIWGVYKEELFNINFLQSFVDKYWLLLNKIK